jgi:hypothetical protein
MADSAISALLSKIKLPRMFEVEQDFERPRILPRDFTSVIESQIVSKSLGAEIKPGMRVAITAGSRGIANVASLTKTIVEYVKKSGAHPFIVPAMGSHGGATAEGQAEILEGYGITEKKMGCAILSSMEVVPIGKSEKGTDVFIDKNAAQADGIIISCRIKPHTCFRGPYESGIMKMMAIGLGKQAGAEACHSAGFKHMAEYVPLFGRTVLKKTRILFAVAVLENAFEETAEIAVLRKDEIEALEPVYLNKARSLLPSLPFDECDVLVCDTIGKNFSGSGMDPNITGTFPTPYASGGLRVQRVAVLDISDESHGNGMGAGSAHASTRRLLNKFDFEKTYPNAITSKVVINARIPCILENDRDAIRFCVITCEDVDIKAPRIIRIKNTMEISRFWASERYINEVCKIANIRIASGLSPMDFDEQGNLF